VSAGLGMFPLQPIPEDGFLPPRDPSDPRHVCGVGSAPRKGQIGVRRCRCGTVYAWTGRLWKPATWYWLWRNRAFLAGDPAWFTGEGDSRDWGAPRRYRLRRLLLRLRGWDA
jgi:hypothetical protein